MATINITTEFVPEIWEQIKEYAGIFPLPTNIIHFDKLTFEELEDNISQTSWDAEENAFGMLGIDNVYAALVWGVTDECREDDNDPLLEYSGGKYFDFGREINKKEKKEMLINVIICEYRSRKKYWVFMEKREFWNGVSELITNCFEKRDEVKAAAKKKRLAAKARKETPKGMIAEINKIEDERRRLMKRMKDDQEKLNKLTTKGREWRTKLDKKRDEVRNSKNQLP